MTSLRCMLLTLTILALGTGPALAEGPSADAYGSDPSLPITGFDLGLLVGGGVALVLMGGALRRLVRSDA